MAGYHNNSTFEAGEHDSVCQNSKNRKQTQSTCIPKWQQVTLSWHNITVTTSKRTICRTRKVACSKTILKNVSGNVRPGRLVAIMGASGAGKTSLINVLTFRNIRSLAVSGDIKINDRVVNRDQMNDVSAYLQQEDVFLGTMTVREHLLFKASLQMNMDSRTRERKVDQVMMELGLSKCADSIIDRPYSNQRISGGERKRLSFASELLMNPPLMFCDEPTSGLDSFMASSVIQCLKMLVHKGHTVLCTIHQPSSEVFALFDEIYLLAEGNCVFTGYTMYALDFFKSQGYPCPINYNPADHFILTLAMIPGQEQACRKKIKRLCWEFENKQMKEKYENGSCTSSSLLNQQELLPRYQAPCLKQFRYLIWRSWITNLRNPNLFIIKLIQAVLFAVILGLFYLKTDNNYTQDDVMNINGCIFFAIVSLSLDSIFPILNVFPSEVPIFVREYGSKLYRVDIYYLSKIIVEIPIHVINPAIFMSILYWMSGLVYDNVEFWTAIGIAVLVANAAAGFGYVISAGAPSITAALALAPLLLMPLMMNGGFFLNNRTVPVYFLWLKYSSWFMYSNELMILNQWANVDQIGCNGNSTCLSNGNLVIESLGYRKDNVPLDWICLASLTIAFRLLSFIILFIKAKITT
uniref:ABC transporter domain-containing protein n=1 Tax=Magallana gigas TaxID=29159 RepID=A0A8W8MAS5_MAGGI|nr:protein white-like [Crassostrea gigas]XP_034308875.1 protein white-like [Crassostrea gigas]